MINVKISSDILKRRVENMKSATIAATQLGWENIEMERLPSRIQIERLQSSSIRWRIRIRILKTLIKGADPLHHKWEKEMTPPPPHHHHHHHHHDTKRGKERIPPRPRLLLPTRVIGRRLGRGTTSRERRRKEATMRSALKWKSEMNWTTLLLFPLLMPR